MSIVFRQRVKDVLDQVLDLAPHERRRYLDQTCHGDATLRLEVESLLRESDATSPWHEGPICRVASTGDRFRESAPRPGERLGPYRVQRLLGEGGMAAVALAVREDDFSMLVALKVVRTGLASEDVLQRFCKEREILARLQHPNIARIYDGGTTPQGLPYFAMEHVEGRTLTDYCRQQGLSIRARIEIFLDVCSAVHFAHQNRVVHCDLKPGNILVTQDGTPKVLDFGIAKCLDPDESSGPRPAAPMTIRYASPEQIENKPITTSVDVYALGVLLYQVLAERWPYRLSGAGSEPQVMEAIIRQQPLPPSRYAFPRRLSGELDSIVLKAMHKEPEARYSCARHLAEDLCRYLDGEAVTAYHGGWSYRGVKFVRRHKWPLAAAMALVSLSLAWQKY